jgi:type I restriction enzyme S subunit
MLTHRYKTILGNIPDDWNRVLLRDCLDLPKCGSGDWGDDSGERGLNVIRSTNITNDGQLSFEDVAVRYFSETKAEHLSLLKDDVLVERSGGGPDQPVGRVVLLRSNLDSYGYGNFIQRLRVRQGAIEPKFLYYCLFEIHRSGVVERLQFQTTQMRNLDYRDYLRIYLPLPEPEEQCAIAKILDASDQVLQLTKELLGIKTSLHREQMQGPVNLLKVSLLQHLLTGKQRIRCGGN